MAKSEEKLHALQLRREGKGIKQIAKELGVSRSSVSVWVRDIELTPDQRSFLTERQIASGHRGRLMGAETNRSKKATQISLAKVDARERFKSLTTQELFYIGLGLYWGEGSKSSSNKSLIMTNSDPIVIQLMIRWFVDCFDVQTNAFYPRVFISKTHTDREELLLEYWSNVLSIPRDQFRKTVFLPKGRKLYENHDIYYGVMALYVAKGGAIRYKILAYIERIGQLASQAGVVQELERGTHKP